MIKKEDLQQGDKVVMKNGEIVKVYESTATHFFDDDFMYRYSIDDISHFYFEQGEKVKVYNDNYSPTMREYIAYDKKFDKYICRSEVGDVVYIDWDYAYPVREEIAE